MRTFAPRVWCISLLLWHLRRWSSALACKLHDWCSIVRALNRAAVELRKRLSKISPAFFFWSFGARPELSELINLRTGRDCTEPSESHATHSWHVFYLWKKVPTSVELSATNRKFSQCLSLRVWQSDECPPHCHQLPSKGDRNGLCPARFLSHWNVPPE
jgi:hypothetical protein